MGSYAEIRKNNPGLSALPWRYYRGGITRATVTLTLRRSIHYNARRKSIMNQNMGTVDRIIRLAAVVVIVVLYYLGDLSGTLAIILGIVALAFLVTSLIGWCPAYLPFGLSTCKSKQH